MTSTLTRNSLRQSSKVLCVVYGGIALAALVATWTQNTAYLHAGIFFLAALAVALAALTTQIDMS
jgi:hypothetical protein